MFRNREESHAHSLQTLNTMYEYDDFMSSISYLVDLGCGDGLDLEWWATRTTRDDNPQPLNIDCIGVDIRDTPQLIKKYKNITYQSTDFEKEIYPKRKTKFDVLWCHDAFQYAVNPIGALGQWYDIANDGAMLAIVVPQTTNLYQKQQNFTQPNGCYYHYTLVNLIHMLAVSGWNCSNGFFRKDANDTWISAIVYKSEHRPMDPKSTSWYDLVDRGLLPQSAADSIKRHNSLRQQDLVLPWLDKSLTWYGKQ